MRHARLGLLFLIPLAPMAGCKSHSPAPTAVSGRYILTLCDADMPATAFYDKQLGARKPGDTDNLTVIELPLREPTARFAQVNVSNSAIGPPNPMAVSRDGRFAFVVESRGPAGENAATIDDLPKGEHLSVVDLADPLKPFVCSTAVVGDEPQAVDIHPAGDIVAVVTHQSKQQLNIVPFVNRELGEPLAWPLIGLDDTEAEASSVAWHPSGRYLAVTLPTRNQVMFYEFTRNQNDSLPGLAPWGEPVNVGKYPYSGRFTPDGRYFITTDLKWGTDVSGFMVEAPQGQLSVIRLSEVPSSVPSAPDEPAPAVVHRVVSTAMVGVSPEGIAISPDGSLVVTSNLQKSFLPTDHAGQTRKGSLSLLTFDKRTGTLTPVGEYPITTGMPVALSFDAKGRFVAVSLFRSFDSSADGNYGQLSFWNVNTGRTPSLSDAYIVVGVGKGPHGVLIVR